MFCLYIMPNIKPYYFREPTEAPCELRQLLALKGLGYG